MRRRNAYPAAWTVAAGLTLAACAEPKPQSGAPAAPQADSTGVGVIESLPSMVSETEAASDTRVWNYSAEGLDPKLTYGTPESDDVALTLRCPRGEGRITASFIRAPAAVETEPSFALVSGQHRAHVAAETEPSMLGQDALLVRGVLSASDTVVESFLRTGRLRLEQAGSAPVLLPADARERNETARFLDACRPEQLR